MQSSQAIKWYQKIPHAITILSFMMLFISILTYWIPAGLYQRIELSGRLQVLPGTYQSVLSTPIGLLQLFEAVPLGFKAAAEIIFIVFAGGIMFGMLEQSKAIERAVAALIRRMGVDKKYTLVVLLSFLYGWMGIAVGYENNIALVPLAALISLAIGGDLILAAGMSVGAMTVGFGLSPINPYTVGTGQKIAELALFSGAGLRSALCFLGLSLTAYYNVRYLKKISNNPALGLGQGLDESGFQLDISAANQPISLNDVLLLFIFLVGMSVGIYGVFCWGWYINQLSAIFLMISLMVALASGLTADKMSRCLLESVAKVAPGAFMVGYATSIKIVLEQGQIGDTLCYYLVLLLEGLPVYAAAISMSIAQSGLNFFIPSGSGQALASLPIMLPLGDVLGLSRQTTILAFQIGDGISNLVNPSLGGLIAMLSMCRVPLDRWLRFAMPLVAALLLLSWLFLILAVWMGYR